VTVRGWRIYALNVKDKLPELTETPKSDRAERLRRPRLRCPGRSRLPKFSLLGDLRQQFDGDVHISQPLGFREHAAEENAAFDPVGAVRIGIDSVEAR
jgi:hypothetical protein